MKTSKCVELFVINITSGKVGANINVDRRNCENKLGSLECKWINSTSALSFDAKIAVAFSLLLFSSLVLQSCLLATNLEKNILYVLPTNTVSSSW